MKEIIPDGDILQAGSLVDADRLRFDFNCPHVVTSEEMLAVECLVNESNVHGYEVEVFSMALNMAKKGRWYDHVW